MFTIEVPQMRLSGSPSIMGDAKFSFPSTMTIFLSLLIALVLITCIRTASTFFGTLFNLSTSTDAEEKGTQQGASHGARGYWRKTWELFWKWEGLPLSLPISLTVSDEMVGVPVGKGVGVGLGAGASVARSEPEMKQNWQLRSSGPAFDHPLPAIYQSEVPVSMAKMIMSRHTIRRPNQRPPPKRLVPGRQQYLV